MSVKVDYTNSESIDINLDRNLNGETSNDEFRMSDISDDNFSIEIDEG